MNSSLGTASVTVAALATFNIEFQSIAFARAALVCCASMLLIFSSSAFLVFPAAVIEVVAGY